MFAAFILGIGIDLSPYNCVGGKRTPRPSATFLFTFSDRYSLRTNC